MFNINVIKYYYNFFVKKTSSLSFFNKIIIKIDLHFTYDFTLYITRIIFFRLLCRET